VKLLSILLVLIEQYDRVYLIEQSHRDTKIALVLLEIMHCVIKQCCREKSLIKADDLFWSLTSKDSKVKTLSKILDRPLKTTY